jgi:lysozyme
MRMSEAGLQFLIGLEGKRNKAYKDTKCLWTIGVGHLLLDTEHEMINKTLTDKEVETLLANDLVRFERCVNQALQKEIKQSQYDALVSLAFNVGCNGFTYSTVVKRIKANEFDLVDEAMRMWNKPKEIIGRREKEIKLFMTGKYK